METSVCSLLESRFNNYFYNTDTSSVPGSDGAQLQGGASLTDVRQEFINFILMALLY